MRPVGLPLKIYLLSESQISRYFREPDCSSIHLSMPGISCAHQDETVT